MRRLRIEPRRWLFIATILVTFTGVGAAIPYRAMGREDAPPSAIILGASIGAGLGLVGAVIAFFYYARNDSRRLEVARQLPHAIVVQAHVDAALRSALGVPIPGSLVTVAFDTEGVSFWTGTTHPERIVFLPAREVLAIGAGDSIPAPNARTQATARVKVTTAAGDIQFVVDRLPHFGSVRYIMSEGEVLQLIEQINRTGRTTFQTSHTGYIDQRVPGQTAWTAQRVIRLAVIPGLLGMFAVAAYLIVRTADKSDDGSAIWLVLAYAALYFLVFRLLSDSLVRAKQRERAAGYTTLSHESFDLKQLHPRTGSLIRPAGAPPLSKDELRRRLTMS